MNKIDYYIVMTALLVIWLGLLYIGENLYSGLFLGIFISKIEVLLGVKPDDK